MPPPLSMIETKGLAMNIWDIVGDHFTKNEAWGNADKMSGFLLLVIHALRKVVGQPFVIHCAYATAGHEDGSQHYVGGAVDFHIEGMSFKDAIAAVEQALTALQIENRVGLGIYPDWPEAIRGFHLDVRGVRARWGRVNGVYVTYEAAKKEVR